MKIPFTFSEFVDLVLLQLYDFDRTGGGEFYAVDVIRKVIKGSVPTDWIFDAAKVLESRGLVQAIYNSRGVFAHLTGEGRLFVEEARGSIKKIKATPDTYFIHVSGDSNQIVTGQQSGPVTQTMANDQHTGPWVELVDSMAKKLKDDPSLDQPQKDEALGYVKVIRNELAKKEPNRSIVAAILGSLSQIVSIAGMVATLVKFFNSY